jgi:hypothetical protein
MQAASRLWTALATVNVLVLGWVIYGQAHIGHEVDNLSGACASSYELQQARESLEWELRSIFGRPAKPIPPTWFSR